jgi:hypothetical protein
VYPRPRIYYLDESSRTPQPACRFIDGHWTAREIPPTAVFVRDVATTRVNSITIQTVFWGHDTQTDPDGPPLLFHVRAASARGTVGEVFHASTHDEADEAHARFVALSREALGLAARLHNAAVADLMAAAHAHTDE